MMEVFCLEPREEHIYCVNFGAFEVLLLLLS